MRQTAPLLLFAEDFDEPAPPTPEPVETPEPAPEIQEPVFSLADLQQARADAIEAEREAVRLEQIDAQQMALRLALADIGHAMEGARQAAGQLAEAHAQATAGLIMTLLRTMLPTMCERYGEAEVRALLKVLQPALRSEPVVTIQLHPITHAAIAHDLDVMRLALPGDVRVTGNEALLPGDVRLHWQDGAASRDTAALLHGIDAAFDAAGFVEHPKEACRAS